MNIIYHDINKSNYYFKYDNLTFYFSSLLYLNKFTKLYTSYIEEESIKLSNKFNMNINAKKFFLLSLYKSIEKRGFRVLFNNKPLERDVTLVLSIEEV